MFAFCHVPATMLLTGEPPVWWGREYHAGQFPGRIGGQEGKQMKYRTLGKMGVQVSEISLGTWQLGGKWGAEYSEKIAQATKIGRAHV